MSKTKSILTACVLAASAMSLMSSCNDDWKDEQYVQYISFKAPIDDSWPRTGVTTVYVPFTRLNDDGTPRYGAEGESSYQLPVLVAGSTDNENDLNVNIAHSDTLPILNYERFGTREELYYKDMSEYATVPTSIFIPKGQNKALLDIRMHFQNLDMRDRYVLPLTIAPGEGYQRNPRKNYATAMLRIYPYNDYSGNFQASNTQFFIVDANNPDNEPGAMSTVMSYAVDDNTCFIYAGKFSELSMDRHPYKIYLHFNAIDDNHGTITMDAEESDINFVQNKVARYQIVWTQDEVQDFLQYYNVIITDIDYNFDDITTSPGRIITYNVRGGMTMQRRLNMQKPVEDQIEF